MDYVTTKEAAQIAGVKPRYIRRLLLAGALEGERLGRDWLVKRRSIEQFAATERRRGRKPQPKPS